MGARIGVVEIHLQVDIAAPGKVLPRSVVRCWNIGADDNKIIQCFHYIPITVESV